MDSIKVGIIGITGRYGQWFERFFTQLGYSVVGSDPKLEEGNRGNQAVVEESSVVLFSVPMDITTEVIREVVPYSREDQLWIDITSLKKEPVDAMLASKAEVIGLHPMVAPTVETLKGQIVVCCPVRAPKWLGWVQELLEKSQATVNYCSPDKHDEYMAYVQGLPHASSLIMAAVLRSMEVDVRKTLEFGTPPYRLAWSNMARILNSGNAELYADIQLMNKSNILSMLSHLEKETRKFYEIIQSDDRQKFIEEYEASSIHLGADVLQKGDELFNRLNRFVADLSDNNSIIIESDKDRPGLLYDIIGILKDEELNMTSLHSFKTKSGYQFMIGLEQKISTKQVQTTLRKIKKDIPGVDFRPLYFSEL
jgi:prephenate dehydrogenase